MLGETRQDVEHRGFAHIGLTGQGDEDSLRRCRRWSLGRFRNRLGAVNRYLFRFPVPQGDPRIPDPYHDQTAAVAEHPDLGTQGNSQPRQAARQFPAAGKGDDYSLLAIGQGNQRHGGVAGQQFFILRHMFQD